MNDEFEYSCIAVDNREAFIVGNEPIVLYVEDMDKEYVYQDIIKQLYSGHESEIMTKVQVVAAGNKRLVKEKYLHNGVISEDGTKHYVYLMDGDFDRYIAPDTLIHDTNVVYLDTYCLESSLINLEACISFVQGETHRQDYAVRSGLHFSEWKERIVQLSKDLFLSFAVLQQFWNSNHNVKIPAGVSDAKKALNSRNGLVKGEKINSIIQGIKETVVDYDARLALIKERYEEIHPNDYYFLICGKYLLHSLAAHIRNVFSIDRIGANQLMEFFRTHIDKNSFCSLKRCVDKQLELIGGLSDTTLA